MRCQRLSQARPARLRLDQADRFGITPPRSPSFDKWCCGNRPARTSPAYAQCAAKRCPMFSFLHEPENHRRRSTKAHDHLGGDFRDWPLKTKTIAFFTIISNTELFAMAGGRIIHADMLLRPTTYSSSLCSTLHCLPAPRAICGARVPGAGGGDRQYGPFRPNPAGIMRGNCPPPGQMPQM